MAYTVATAAMLGAFWACPNVAWMQWLLVAGVGFTLYGPQMLIGLCGAEVVPKASVSAANGMLGWISYLGALLPNCVRLLISPDLFRRSCHMLHVPL